MNSDWKQDPLLKQMSQEKIDFLTAQADILAKTPKERIMPTFLAMQRDAMQKKIRFSDQESDLLMRIFSSNMNEEERKRLETFTALAKKLAAGS